MKKRFWETNPSWTAGPLCRARLTSTPSHWGPHCKDVPWGWEGTSPRPTGQAPRVIPLKRRNLQTSCFFSNADCWEHSQLALNKHSRQMALRALSWCLHCKGAMGRWAKLLLSDPELEQHRCHMHYAKVNGLIMGHTIPKTHYTASFK